MGTFMHNFDFSQGSNLLLHCIEHNVEPELVECILKKGGAALITCRDQVCYGWDNISFAKAWLNPIIFLIVPQIWPFRQRNINQKLKPNYTTLMKTPVIAISALKLLNTEQSNKVCIKNCVLMKNGSKVYSSATYFACTRPQKKRRCNEIKKIGHLSATFEALVVCVLCIIMHCCFSWLL